MMTRRHPISRCATAALFACALLALAPAALAADGLIDTTLDVASADATGPPARNYAVLAYDEGEHLAVMMGGLRYGGDWEGLDDIWIFDPETETWERVGELQGLIFDSIAYDARAGKLIAYCGFRYNPASHFPWAPVDPISETWAYDVSTGVWENLDPGPIRPPKALGGARMAYDAESGVVILHGGLSWLSNRLSDQTWAYDSASNTWRNMRPAGAPGGRTYHGLTYHAAADRVLAIAGFASAGVSYSVANDVFAYDYNHNLWTQLDSGNAPARAYVSAAYVPSVERVILFGGAAYADSDPGLTNPIPNADTWEFDYFSDTWTLLQPRKSPSPRIWHGMTATERGLILFGGGETRDTPNAETWLFNAKSQEWRLPMEE